MPSPSQKDSSRSQARITQHRRLLQLDSPLGPDLLLPQRLIAIDSGGWYWTAGAKDSKFKTINLKIKSLTINETSVQSVAEAINGLNPTTLKPNNLTERVTETIGAQKILMDDKR